MKITIGEWKMRDGRKAVVAGENINAKGFGQFVGWVDNEPHCWGDYGRTSPFPEVIDLIAPWTDPVPWDWSTTPPWINWIAMDTNNVWFMYEFDPEQAGSAWISNRGAVHLIPPSHAPKWTGDWKQSKTMRPGYKEAG